MRSLAAGKCLPLLTMTVPLGRRMTASVAAHRFRSTYE